MEKTIMVSEWGATMAMVDFYEVLKTSPKTILVREIGHKEVEATGFLSGSCIPDPDTICYERSGPEERQEVRLRLYPTKTDGLWFSRTHGFKKFMRVWNGQPVHFNHCD